LAIADVDGTMGAARCSTALTMLKDALNHNPENDPNGDPERDPERDPEIDQLNQIYDALDRGEATLALALAEQALRDSPEADPVVHLLGGRALLELDRPQEAVDLLSRATEVDPEDPELRTYLAWALFRSARFDMAADHARRALALDEHLPEAHYVQGLLDERRRAFDAADRHFRRAASLAPEWFTEPERLGEADFGAALESARTALDEPFRSHLGQVPVLIEDLPSDALVFDGEPPLDAEQTLGLFVGATLAEVQGGEAPPRIYLFKRNLERFASERDDLIEQIRITLYHELGHYLGMDEAQLESLGYD
jgi:predicted Zn-dependent protease with MMP-like domain/Flp pilus assembly protein TadD